MKAAARTVWGNGFELTHHFHATDATVDKAVKHCAGAKTHGSVHAARGFTGCEESGNRLIVRAVKRAALHIGEDPAHAVVDLRR